MALPTKNLPFEYTDRWAQVGDLFVPRLSAALVRTLDERDKDLEDYLAGLETGGGCCTKLFAGTCIGGSISTSTSVDIVFVAANTSDIYPTEDADDELASGVWVITGYIQTQTSTPATGAAFINPPASVTQTPGLNGIGGTITGQANYTAAQAEVANFSGIVALGATWNPAVRLTNSTGQTITGYSGKMYAHRICDTCDYTVVESGG